MALERVSIKVGSQLSHNFQLALVLERALGGESKYRIVHG